MLELPNLPYNYNSLAEFGMGEETMKYHHGLHHKAYVDNGNKLLDGSEWQNKNIDEIILGSYDPTAKFQNGIFNNVAQHLNHCEFWKMMSPEKCNIPSELEKLMTESFGSTSLRLLNELEEKLKTGEKVELLTLKGVKHSLANRIQVLDENGKEVLWIGSPMVRLFYLATPFLLDIITTRKLL